MNREIKFRVYDKDLKRMRYLNNSHDFICFDEKGNGYYHNMQTGLGEWFSDLMQYVGLKDKNGVEIYEGDKVKAKFYGKEVVGEIGFNSGCFLLWNSCVSDNQLFIFTDIEVIGNIYENEVD